MQLSNAMPPTRGISSRLVRLVLPFVFLALAAGLSVLLFDYLQGARLFLFVAAVVLSTWFSGSLSGLLCTIVALPLADFLVIEPRYTFYLSTDNLIQFSLFTLISLTIVTLDAKRQHTQNQLTDTTLRLYTIIDSLGDSISVRDEKGHVIIANKKLAMDMGYETVAAMLKDTTASRRTRFTMYDEEGRLMLYDRLPHQTVFEENRPIETTFRGHNNQTGEDRWYTVRASPVRDQKGLPRFVVNVIRDVTALRSVQDLRDDANQQIRDLIDNVTALIALLNPDGTIIEINKAALKSAGVRREDAIGVNAADSYWWSYSPESQELIRWLIERARAGASVRMDAKIRVANGKFMDIDFTISPVFDKEGNVKYLVPSAIDITDRKKKETELHNLNMQLDRQQTRLKILVENVPGMIWEGYGPPGNQTFDPMNDFSEKLIGYPIQAWKQTPELWFSLMHPDDLERCMNESKIIYESGQSGTIEFRAIHRDGHIVHIEARTSILKDANGQSIGACGVFMDVTERKNREIELQKLNEQLNKQQARLRLVFENVPGLIWELYRESSTKNTEIVSDYAEVLLGYPPKAWQETENFWRTIVHPDDLESTTQKTAAIVESGKPGGYEFRCIHRDGHIVPIEAHLSLLKDGQGTPVGICGVFMDLTERKKYEEQLSEKAEALRRSNAELETFAYLASHDLQEPLRMISSYLQLLEQRYGDRLDGDAKEFIAYAVDGSSRMKMLINDLLTYSRVQRAERVYLEVDLEKTLQRSLHNLQLAIEDARAEITHDPLPKIMGNETQFMQVFQNLIGNALKFRRADPPKIHVGVREEEDHWLFSVSDNGIGIDNQFLDRIFVIFQRLHSKTKYPGTGIGLAICKRVIENHQGKIWAESTVNVGTTFYFTLPCKPIER